MFECKRCGFCCQGESTISLSEKEIIKIAEFLKLSKTEFLEKYTVKKGKFRTELKVKNGFCIFFDKKEKICKIHPAKPEKCKEWPLVSSIFKDKDSFKIIKSFCPALRDFSWEQLKFFKNLHK